MLRSILIEARDPLIFRDARPAEAGLPIRSLDWPLPSTVAGAIRTRLGRLTGFDAGVVERLRRVEHVGPALAIRKDDAWQLAFPAPADAVLFENANGVEVCALRPAPPKDQHEGTNIPAGLFPLFGARQKKPLKGPPFWSTEATLAWLENNLQVRDPHTLGPDNLTRQRRIHLEIDPATLTAKEGQLFSTEGLEFAWQQGLCAGRTAGICSRIRTANGEWAPLEAVAPLGAERRLAYWSEPDIPWPEAPAKMAAVQRLRLQLITPAAFGNGWKPKWLGDRNEGSPPEFPSASAPRSSPLPCACSETCSSPSSSPPRSLKSYSALCGFGGAGQGEAEAGTAATKQATRIFASSKVLQASARVGDEATVIETPRQQH